MAEHVLQIRNKENNAHLLLQLPAPQPRVVLEQLLIAQAVLHRGGDVTHPKRCRSVRCAPASSDPPGRTHCCRQYSKSGVSDQYANAGLDSGGPRLYDEAAAEDGYRLRMIHGGCHGSDIPAREGIKTERDREVETEKERVREKLCEANRVT